MCHSEDKRESCLILTFIFAWPRNRLRGSCGSRGCFRAAEQFPRLPRKDIARPQLFFALRLGMAGVGVGNVAKACDQRQYLPCVPVRMRTLEITFKTKTCHSEDKRDSCLILTSFSLGRGIGSGDLAVHVAALGQRRRSLASAQGDPQDHSCFLRYGSG
jgi:hypothetical protein